MDYTSCKQKHLFHWLQENKWWLSGQLSLQQLNSFGFSQTFFYWKSHSPLKGWQKLKEMPWMTPFRCSTGLWWFLCKHSRARAFDLEEKFQVWAKSHSIYTTLVHVTFPIWPEICQQKRFFHTMVVNPQGWGWFLLFSLGGLSVTSDNLRPNLCLASGCSCQLLHIRVTVNHIFPFSL